jgi:hypothetical protein
MFTTTLNPPIAGRILTFQEINRRLKATQTRPFEAELVAGPTGQMGSRRQTAIFLIPMKKDLETTIIVTTGGAHLMADLPAMRIVAILERRKQETRRFPGDPTSRLHE